MLWLWLHIGMVEYHHHHSVVPKGRSFTANSGTKAAFLPKGRSSTANSGTKVAVLLGWTGAVASHCFLHPTLSLASEQTLKDLKRSQRPSMKVRRVDLVNWALRTSPKFTIGIKYQFHQGFWPDQRSGNPNYPSPPGWTSPPWVFCPRVGPSLQAQEPRLQFYRRQVFHHKLRNKGCSFTRDWIGVVASLCFPHPTISLASEQTLKDLKRSQGHQRGGEESGFD